MHAPHTQTPLSGFEAEPLDTTHEFHVTGTRVRRRAHALLALTHMRVSVSAGHDMQSLLYAFLDELLFVFLTEFMVIRELTLRRIERGATWELRATGCVRDALLTRAHVALSWCIALTRCACVSALPRCLPGGAAASCRGSTSRARR